MSYFAFLYHVNQMLAELAEQVEAAVWASPRPALLRGRLFGERLAALVAGIEKVEPDYAIQQVERLQLFAQRDILSEDIREGFEWLRINGDAAAHDPSEVPTDLSLTADRYVYLLSAWYAETYGLPGAIIPEYRRPQPSFPEKMREVEEQLPLIDKRFGETVRMEVGEAQQEDEQGIEIADYLTDRSLSIIDKRDHGGCLWVVGGWELKDAFFALKEQGFYFRFARSGSQSTKREPAWFLTGKDPTERRYVSAHTTTPTGTEMDEAAVPEEEAAAALDTEVFEEYEEGSTTQSNAERDWNLEAQPDRREQIEVNSETEASVKVPSYLQWREVSSYKPSRMSEIAGSLGIVYFNDWSEDRLHELYRQQPKLLHDMLVQLWFYGFEFVGEWGRFIKLERTDEWAAVPSLTPGLQLEDRLALNVVRQLERFGIRTSDQLIGLPQYSLQWLLRHRYEVVQKALQPYILHPTAEETVGTAAPNDQSSHIVRSADYVIEIPSQLLTFPIQDVPIYGCAAFLKGMIENCNVTVLGDLPNDLSSLLANIKGAGAGALEKMAGQLERFVSKNGELEQVVASDESNKLFADQTTGQSKKLIWGHQVLELSDSDLSMPITTSEYPSVKRITRYLEEQGITSLGLLPMMLTQLSKGDSVGKTSIDKFAELLIARLEEYRSEILMREQLEAMSDSERIDYSLQRTMEKLAAKLTEEAIDSNRNLQIVYTSWLERKEGRKATLEWLGQKFGLTRERVRQIMPKVLRSFHPDVIELERALNQACTDQHGFFYYPMDINDSFGNGLIELVIEEVEGLIYLESYGWWTTRTLEEVNRVEQALRQQLNVRLRGRVWDEESLRGIVNVALQEEGLPSQLAWNLIARDLETTTEGNYFLRNSRKWEVVEMVLRQFPQGVEVYKREEELMALANIIKPSEYVKERDFAAVFSRDEFMDIAYLWGRGAFIHHEYVHVDESLVQEVSDRALELLEKRSPISVNRLYLIFEERLQEGGIPTEYALYTMLRKLGSSKLAPNKFPHIWHSDDAFQLSNAEQIKVYIREHREPMKIEHLRDEFVGKRGWKRFTLEFSISTDPDFVSTDHGVVGLREFYPYTGRDLAPIADKLQELLAETGVIHVNRLYEDMLDSCASLGIGSSFLLYDLLKGTEGDKYRMVRYPLILSADHPAGELTLQTLVEQYLEEQEAEVAREVVYQWVTEEVGARAVTLDSVLAASKEIYFYRDGQFGEYIHRKRFGWTDEKARHLVDAVMERLDGLELQGVPYTTITQLLSDLDLPELEADLAWTEALFTDCLRKSGGFQLLGSYDHVVVKRDHPEIACDTDWLAYILRSEYGGRASRADWQRRLAELKYSKDGKFLLETTAKLESGSAPFVVEDEGVVSVEEKQLNFVKHDGL
ncbi:hypothetical protein [Cohnella hashimotonis]|uniref:RNA polymerase sigma-70 region 4 domain-containing protein n=1 Tax=Cohnella hashimotonis TaxID=2826895 RepID=A0ABT6TM89_9BACL|nr:hypothetical protein [Cohnella hashimotonis]MDI4647870.1 hypothetical protein [Cohnella hashimotonis]